MIIYLLDINGEYNIHNYTLPAASGMDTKIYTHLFMKSKSPHLYMEMLEVQSPDEVQVPLPSRLHTIEGTHTHITLHKTESYQKQNDHSNKMHTLLTGRCSYLLCGRPPHERKDKRIRNSKIALASVSQDPIHKVIEYDGQFLTQMTLLTVSIEFNG